eukprot:CAMPEP_0119376144 /NCGR_PEP_ID=MMETSP1334-20130426/39130_1 /TAXON_ID=127549 /ORGANISM="Calcidiscus leptoporus, Strain RCC1130" /LENGTH=236 /DNA_ID=CAMNT_0007394645 /DNA_START=59 /DNA_END=769 /DNA_ORIENTATION=+
MPALRRSPPLFLLCIAAVCRGHKLELSSPLNAKVALLQPFEYKGCKATLLGNYDFDSKRCFLKDAAAAGSAPVGPAKLAYKATYNFVKSKASLALNGKVGSTTLTTNIEGSKPVKAAVLHTLNAGRFGLSLEPAWLIKAKSGVLSTTTTYSGDKHKVGATIDASLKGELSYDVSYERPLSSGRVASATVVPQKQKLALKYVDARSEPGATWTAKTTIAASNLLRLPAVEVSRVWSF